MISSKSAICDFIEKISLQNVMKMNRGCLNHRGFTLLEIIIVLSLLILMVSLSAVYYANSLPSFRLNAATRDITAEIRKARALARIQNEKQTLLINLDKRTFGIVGGKVKDIPEGIAVRIVDPLTGEVSKGAIPIIFQPAGGSAGYSIRLSSSRRLQTIQMDPVIGAGVVR